MATPNTHFGAERIASLLADKKHLFFIGIGGVNMSSLAEISKARGFLVSGSDHAKTPITDHLVTEGISVYFTHDAANLKDADAVVYTVAVPPDNPEYREAQRRGLPLISRADYLGYVMTAYPRRIGISGMHGKSTTTSMCAEIFYRAGKDPTVTSGASLSSIGGYYRIGKGEDFLFEACEYMDSFLDFYPSIAVILNIEMDHVDYFPDLAAIRASYAAFADKTDGTKDHLVIYPGGDPEVESALADYTGNRLTFGISNSGAYDFSARDVVYQRGKARFQVDYRGNFLTEISLQVPGHHQVKNALASVAAATVAGISGEEIGKALSGFRGADRRMEYKGKVQGADVYDDYGHHPSEVRSTLEGAKEMGYRRLYCIFQPHTYSRTKALFSEFLTAFEACDEVFFVDIYAAREFSTLGVSSALLAKEIGEKAHYTPTFLEAAEAVKKKLCPGDLLLVMGAGNVCDLFPHLGLTVHPV